MFKIGIHSNSYHGFSLSDAVSGTSKAGFRYIELTAVPGWTEHVDPDMTDKEVDGVLALLRDHGLTATALSGHANIMDAAGMKRLLACADLAGRLKVGGLVTSVGEAHDDKEVYDDEKPLQAALGKLLERCEKNGVKLNLEIHGDSYATSANLIRLLSFSKSPNIGICYDTANCLFYGKVNADEDIAGALPRLNSLHLKDKAGKRDEWNFPAIGKGTVDFRKIFSVIHNFSGPMNVEIEFTPEGPGSLAAVDAAVKDSRTALVGMLGPAI